MNSKAEGGFNYTYIVIPKPLVFKEGRTTTLNHFSTWTPVHSVECHFSNVQMACAIAIANTYIYTYIYSYTNSKANVHACVYS